MKGDSALIDAAAATQRLGISRATLYAYVSRGQVRAVADPADSRRSLYRAEDVQALLHRKRRGRSLTQVAQSALDWGPPILDSAITLIHDGRLYYRGRDAVELAKTASVEAAARGLWDCGAVDPFAVGEELPVFTEGLLARLSSQAPIERCAGILPLGEAATVGGGARNQARLWAEGARLLRLLAAAAVAGQPSAAPLHVSLGAAWRLAPAQAELIRAALILSADHELNVSTFTVRCVASTGAGLPAALLAGLAALSGPAHGGMTARVEALLEEIGRSGADVGEIRALLSARLQRGESLPGFGHPLYADGDPRGAALVDLLPLDDPGRRIVASVEQLSGEAPNLDFGLAALARHLKLPAGTAFTLFALGRGIGWIAHALEQRAQPGLIRPRARYIGPMPA
ncbi:MAG TPA: citrate/2-methylcitrate synthase [Aliidongia sp.]|nr:citrate/2-methylcitrate synthase [Aliidongia sp.]